METNMYKKMVLGILLLVAAGICVNSSQIHAAEQEKDLAFLKEQDDLYALLNNKLKLALKPEDLDEEQNKWLVSLGVNSPDSEKNSIINKAFNKLRGDREKYEKERSKIVVNWDNISHVFLSGIYNGKRATDYRIQRGNTIKEIKDFFIKAGNNNKFGLPYSIDYMKVIVNGEEQCDDAYELKMGDLVEIKYEKTIGEMASGICDKAKKVWLALPGSEGVREKLWRRGGE